MSMVNLHLLLVLFQLALAEFFVSEIINFILEMQIDCNLLIFYVKCVLSVRLEL